MTEEYDYDAAASAVKIEDITTDEINRKILRKLKENDPIFVKLWVTSSRDDEYDYCPQSAREMGWLGYFIGKNTKLQRLYLRPIDHFNDAIWPFCRGVNSNRSIRKISFNCMDLSDGEIFQSLRLFFENNNSIYVLDVSGCDFGGGGVSHFSMALRGCNKSLTYIRLENIRMGGGEGLSDIIEALSAHPQLEKLELMRMNIGTNECRTLATLIHTTPELHTINLTLSDIDDEGVDVLAGAFINSSLRVLSLSHTRNITIRGWQSIAALLENPNSTLEELDLSYNNVGDEGAHIFANALASNRKLKTLSLCRNDITAEGWSSFSKVLCDTSSIDNTFLSNHTLSFEHSGYVTPLNLPDDVRFLGELNRSSEDKWQVAIKKILKHHQHFDMQPFFEWDLKMLPTTISWFERARSIVNDNNEAGIDKQKLGAIYQFIRAMPEVFEPAPVIYQFIHAMPDVFEPASA